MKNKKGFTLIELVVVFAILAILAGISVPLVFTYLQTSRIMQYNDYAKTIYLSAQSYLTNERGAGQLSAFDTQTEADGLKVDSTMVLGSYYGGEDTYYMMQDKGTVNAQLQAMLAQYISDPFILEQSICVEYNSKTGSIYSVSYSEVADGFFYNTGNDREGNRVSISDRSAEKRKDLRFGYYSVQLLDAPPELTALDPSTVNLINEEQLYLKWSDAQPAGSSVGSELTYTVKLRDAMAGASAAPLVSMEVKAKDVNLKNNLGIDTLDHYLVECVTTIYQPDGSAAPSTTQKHWIYRVGNEFFLVLDSIDTSASGGAAPTRGIFAAYPNIGARKLQASVSAAGVGCRPNQETLSNTEHSLFANQQDKNTQVSRVRHLFNLRYGTADLQITQLKDLDWREPLEQGMMIHKGNIVKEAEAVNGDGTIKNGSVSAAFGTIAYVNPDGSTITPFSGSYEGGGRTISGLYLTSRRASDGTPVGETGLFAQNAGTIQHVTLKELTLRDGLDHTAAITGINLASGRLEDIHVENTADTWELTAKGDNVGGIAGKNAGKMIRCSTNSAVEGQSNVGGIVGLNLGSGEVLACETTGGSVTGKRDGGNSEYVGGIIGKNESTGAAALGPYTNAAAVTGDRFVGGIIGSNDAGTIRNCTNTGFIWAKKEYGGGITGSNGTKNGQSGTIENCVSNVRTDNLSQAELEARATGDFIGGITGYNNGSVTGASSENPSKISGNVMGKNYVGGVIGHNDTKGVVRFCEVTEGSVVAKEDFAGGFFGLNTSLHSVDQGKGIELRSNPTLVKGRHFVGGSIGANLVAMGGTGEASMTISSVNGTSGGTGRVEAQAFAGGVVGYGGVVSADGDLENALDQLRQINPETYIPDEGAVASNVTTIISNSRNYLSVTANRYVGGIIGLNSGASKLTITKCSNGGILSVDTASNQASYDETAGVSYYIGGITGRNSQSGLIDGCVNNGKVISLSKYTGGITEINNGIIQHCDNAGFVTSTKDWVGGIVGLNGETNPLARVENCKALGLSEVHGRRYLGALVGENAGIIEGCTSAGLVQGVNSGETEEEQANFVGGIVGVSKDGGKLLNNETLPGSRVVGHNYVGGIVGKNESATTMNGITNAAQVTGNNYVGGIVGQLGADNAVFTISNCVNQGIITATNNVGITEVGGITGANRAGCKISDCKNEGDVTGGGDFTGGIVSYNDGELIDCYAVKGTVTGARSAGGLVGLNQNGGTIAYKDQQETPTEKKVVLASNVKSQSTAQTQDAQYYLGGLMAKNESKNQTLFANYKFIGELRFLTPSKDMTPAAAKQYAGGILPMNRAEDSLVACGFQGKIYGGNGGAGGITGVNNGSVTDSRVGEETALVNSTGISGGLIGVCATGSTEGNLTNGNKLTVEGAKWVGGFYGKYDKLLQSIALTGVENFATVSGSSNVGGIAGELIVDGYTLTNCVNRGTVRGGAASNKGAAVGGLIGYTSNLRGGAKFENCANQGAVAGQFSGKVGGLLGHSVVTSAPGVVSVINSKNAMGGSVTGENASDIGGLVGYAEGKHSFEGCVNEGTVSTRMSKAGGIVGSVWVNATSARGPITLTACQNLGTVKGEGGKILSIGGIAGYSSISGAQTGAITITNCSNGTQAVTTALVQGGGKVGGIMGENFDTGNDFNTLKVEQCSNYGSVIGSDGKMTGGIVGFLSGKGSLVKDCMNQTAGKITNASEFTGGIVGQAQNNSAVKGCINEGSVQSSSLWTGGIIGQYNGNKVTVTSADGVVVADCVNKGTVGGITSGARSGTRVGGILGGFLGVNGTTQLTAKNCVNEGTILYTGMESGGIAGRLETNAQILDCTNGSETVPAKGQLTNTSNFTGGISGSVMAGSTVKNSKNYRSIWNAPVSDVPASITGDYIGGIAGQMSQGLIENCENFGGIKQPKSYVGGIVGVAVGNEPVLRGNFNHGEISANTLVGGLAGDITATSALVEKSVNYGAVSGQIKATDINVGVGGLVGRFHVANAGGPSFLQDSVNYGKVSGGEINMGGIVGYMHQAGNNREGAITVQRCANFGALDIQMNQADMMAYGFGGIAGKVESFSTVDSCYNFGKITADKSAANVGGIAGLLFRSSSIVQRSINSADIDAKDAGTVGGVVGLNHGTVISCQNTALDLSTGTAEMKTLYAFAEAHKPTGAVLPAPMDGMIAGDRDVGGIVGINESTAAEHSGMIYSEKSTNFEDRTFDNTQNTMEIQAHPSASGQNVGGLVGNLRSGSIVGGFNTGAVGVFGRDGTLSGAVGRADRNAQSESLVAGVFNLGTVGEEGDPAGLRGGIVGERVTASAAQIPVKDAFFLAGDVPETSLPSVLKPDTSVSGRWRIGNEPEEKNDVTGQYNVLGENDAVHDDADGHIRAELNDADFGAEYTKLTGQAYTGTDLDTIKVFLHAYAPRLNAPEVLDVTINPETGNAYTVTWEGGQGALSGYQLEYQIYHPDGTIKEGDIRTSEIILPDEERKSAMAFPPDLIGHFFTVGVKALGAQGEDGTAITLDSDVKHTEKRYLILPPLLTPTVSAENIGGTTYQFKITNLSEYQIPDKPKADYPGLATIQDPANQAIYDEAYKAYINGLDRFYLFDKADVKNPLVFTKQGEDYIAERTFNLGGATQKLFNLYSTAAPKAGAVPTYYVSNPFDLPLLVKQKLILDPPVFERMEYTGTLDEPSYMLHFTGVPNAASYHVVITLADGTQTLLDTAVTSGGVGSKTVTIPKELLTEEWLGKGCTISLQSIAADPATYIDSIVTQTPFTIISRLPDPTVTLERVGETDRYQANWAGTGGTYGVNVTQQTTGSADPPKKLFPASGDTTGETSYTVDYTYESGGASGEDTKITQGFQLTAEVQQMGEQGVSLSSNKVTATTTVYPRLSQITEPGAVVLPTNPLDWTFTWTPGTALPDNCEGFLIYRTDVSPYALIGETDVGTTSLHYVFTEEDAGKSVPITVVAKGKPGVSSSSVWGAPVTVPLPSQPNPPANFAVNPVPPTDPVSAADFEALMFTASWDQWSDTINLISAFELQLVDDMGDDDETNDVIVLTKTINDPNAVSQEFKVSPALAGKTLRAKLRGISTTTLNSKWTELSLTMPKVELDMPVLVRNGDSGGSLIWEKIPYATGYQVRYGPSDSTLTTKVLGAEENFFVLRSNTAVCYIMALGDTDAKYYLNSEEALWTDGEGVVPPVPVPPTTPLQPNDSGPPKDSGPVPVAAPPGTDVPVPSPSVPVAPPIDLAPPPTNDTTPPDTQTTTGDGNGDDPDRKPVPPTQWPDPPASAATTYGGLPR